MLAILCFQLNHRYETVENGAEVFWGVYFNTNTNILVPQSIQWRSWSHPKLPSCKASIQLCTVKETVLKNRRVDIRVITENLNISYESTQHSMGNVLGVKSVKDRLVPKKLNLLQESRWEEVAKVMLDNLAGDPGRRAASIYPHPCHINWKIGIKYLYGKAFYFTWYLHEIWHALFSKVTMKFPKKLFWADDYSI